jgi:hypothetical protein
MMRSLKNKMKFSIDAYTEIVDKFRICDFSFIPIRAGVHASICGSWRPTWKANPCAVS